MAILKIACMLGEVAPLFRGLGIGGKPGPPPRSVHEAKIKRERVFSDHICNNTSPMLERVSHGRSPIPVIFPRRACWSTVCLGSYRYIVPTIR